MMVSYSMDKYEDPIMKQIIPDIASNLEGPSPGKEEVYRTACLYVEKGLSLIPIMVGGVKNPAFSLLPRKWDEEQYKWRSYWSCFKEVPPTASQLKEWFCDSEGDYGLGVLGGKVSGGLEIIDCDNWDAAKRWAEAVYKLAPKLLNRLVLVQTPRPGLHAYYRCSEYGGSQKLARIPDPEKGPQELKAIIELKGEAGYCLAPPSPASCHKTGRCYRILGTRKLSAIQTILPAERSLLISCARALDCKPEPKRPPISVNHQKPYQGPLRPGDDFNQRTDWGSILTPHGWSWEGHGGDGNYTWVRPGKNNGTSATTNYRGSDLLYVFSSNAEPFEELKGYSKFHAYTILEHGGDFQAAAKKLSKMGYGHQSKSNSLDKRFQKNTKYPIRFFTLRK